MYRTRTLFFPITYVQYTYVIPQGNVRSHLASVFVQLHECIEEITCFIVELPACAQLCKMQIEYPRPQTIMRNVLCT